MTDSIVRVSGLPSATSAGTGSAKDKRGPKRLRHESDQDSVTISAEARRRFSSNVEKSDSNEEE